MAIGILYCLYWNESNAINTSFGINITMPPYKLTELWGNSVTFCGSSYIHLIQRFQRNFGCIGADGMGSLHYITLYIGYMLSICFANI